MKERSSMKTFKNIVEILTKRGESFSTMESCTGGGIANAITNVEGSSEVFHYGAVTYSNDFKVKMGVSQEILDTYTVYSSEIARNMSEAITMFTDSDYGIGVTGKLNRADPNNMVGEDNKVFLSIYDKKEKKHTDFFVYATKETRDQNKELVIDEVILKLEEVLSKKG